MEKKKYGAQLLAAGPSLCLGHPASAPDMAWMMDEPQSKLNLLALQSPKKLQQHLVGEAVKVATAAIKQGSPAPFVDELSEVTLEFQRSVKGFEDIDEMCQFDIHDGHGRSMGEASGDVGRA